MLSSKNQKINKSFISNKVKGKHSKLEYKEVKRLDNYYIYKITPYTGRHHQIRVQLSSKGSPIKGDLKYGAKEVTLMEALIFMQAKFHIFTLLQKKKIEINAPLPNETLWNLVRVNI